MANSRISEEFREYVTINAAPGVDGYFTNAVNPNQNLRNTGKPTFFSIRDSGTAADMVVTVQFKCENDTDWTDYAETSIVQRNQLEDQAVGVQWRAGVKNGDYTSGELRLGFDW